MTRQQAENRIQELRKILWENSRKYYVENAPVISDYDYDHLMYELADLENQYPDLITPDSRWETLTISAKLRISWRERPKP